MKIQVAIHWQTDVRKVHLCNVMISDNTTNVDSSTETTPRVTNQEMKMPNKKAMKLPYDDDDTI